MTTETESRIVEKRAAPAPSRLVGATKLVFLQLCRGPILYMELVDAMEENPATIRSALFRLKTYGLVTLGQDSFYSLTELGEEYRKIFESSPEIRMGFPKLPPPPGKLDQNIGFESKDRAQSDLVFGPSALSELQVSSMRASSELQVSSTDLTVQSGFSAKTQRIVNDRKPRPSLPPSGAGGRGESGFRTFRALSRQEADAAFDAIQNWREKTSPTIPETKIVGTMLLNVCIHSSTPRNQKMFNSIEEAANFFELGVGEFNNAILTLKQRRIAYLYEVQTQKKVGIYLDFLDLLRSGRWFYE